MKSIKAFIAVITVYAGFAACNKDATPQQGASLNVINATVDAGSVKVNSFGESFVYANCPSINYGSTSLYTIVAGTTTLTIVPSSDTLHPICIKTISAEAGGIYSLYLAGQSPTYDTLLLKDIIPYRGDSSVGVRFINLSPNSTPVNITLSATPAVNEFSNLSYKQITSFKTYPALSANGSYVFQVRDAATNTLLVNYTLSTPRFLNCTLVLRGLAGGSPMLGITRVNNY